MSMRKRQKAQKMLWRPGLVFILGLVTGLNAAVLPDQFGEYKRGARGSVEISDRPVWDEYGFQTAERAEYEAGSRKVDVSVWQLNDSTGAAAAAQWLQPAVIQHGNYLLRLEGGLPAADLTALKSKLPKVDRAASPTLLRFFPSRNRIPGSERYVLGPVSLNKFEPRITGGLAGFDKGAEGQMALYKTGGEDARLLLLSYPTPQIAGDRFRQLEKVPEVRARRHGPMVAVVMGGTPQGAETLLSSIAYKPSVSWSEPVPKNENPGDMILAICMLALALIVASVVLGLFFGGFRIAFGKFGVQHVDDSFTSLHLDR